MSRQEKVRKEVLFQLYADRPRVRSADQMEREARKNGLDFSRREIEQEAAFLGDDGLLIAVEMRGTSERLYRIHASGVKHYEQNFAA